MRRARGPRPRSIRWFAALFIAQGALAFGLRLVDLERVRADLAALLPHLAITRDTAIVVVCAQWTIALIPVALVWLRASRLARAVVPAMALARLVALPGAAQGAVPRDALAAGWLLALLLAVAGAALLFTRESARWFAGDASARR